ncbi:flavin reductase family protein [Paraconexibacter sp.]
MACDLRELLPGGDHTIGIGTVTAVHHEPQGDPLVWFGGRYCGIA